MRRYRDMFKGVAEANAHFSQFFAGLGLTQVAQSYIELRSRGVIGGRDLEISLTNIGKWEVSCTRLEVSLPTQVEALLAVGEMVPPLRRVGMKVFGSSSPAIKCYAHDTDWGRALLNTSPGLAMMERLEDGQFLLIEPGRMTWAGEILQKDDAWINAQLELLASLVTAAERLPPGKAVPDSMVRRHAGAIALGLGVLGAGCAIAAIVAIIGFASSK